MGRPHLAEQDGARAEGLPKEAPQPRKQLDPNPSRGIGRGLAQGSSRWGREVCSRAVLRGVSVSAGCVGVLFTPLSSMLSDKEQDGHCHVQLRWLLPGAARRAHCSAPWEGKQGALCAHSTGEPGFLLRGSNSPQCTPSAGFSPFTGSLHPSPSPSVPQHPSPWGVLGSCCLWGCRAAAADEARPREAGCPPRPPSAREEAEMLQSSGDQRDHGRAANPPTAPGPLQLTPVLRGAWVPPLCDGCETPLSPLLLRPWPCHPVGFWGAAGRG